MILVEKPARNIKIRSRIRVDLGSLDELAASIKSCGLLQPIVIGEDGYLIAGFRRLQAHEMAGIDLIQCRVVQNTGDLLAAFDMEAAENVQRKEFTPSEMVRAGKMREELLRAAEKPPVKASTRGTVKADREATRLPIVSEGDEADALPAAKPFSKAAKAAAKSVGTTPQTYADAKAVVEAAEAEPGEYGDLPAKMDKEGVAPAKRALDERKTKKGRMPDKAGVEVPALLRDLFGDPWFGECEAALAEVVRVSQRIAILVASKAMAYKWLRGEDALVAIQNITSGATALKTGLADAKPAYVCDFCKGKGHTPGMDDKPQNCTDCHGTGYLPAWRFKELYEEAE